MEGKLYCFRENQNVEEAWNNLKTKLMELREKFVPKKIKLPKPSWNNKGSFPIDKSLQDAIRNKRATHCQWMSVNHCDTTTNVTSLRYVRARNTVKTMMCQAKRRFERDIAKKSKSDPKVFWSHIRHRLETKSGVAPLLENPQVKDSMKFSDVDKANILQNQFSSVYVKEPEGDIPILNCRTLMTTIAELHVTSNMVQQEILNMNVNKSCGPDEISPRILKELVDLLSEPITLILHKMYENGELPHDWKFANISPIFKKGSRSLAENYHPISLTSVVCKLMEVFVKRVIMQYGFISGRSTTTQLLTYLDKCIESIINGIVDTIYLHFSKAVFPIGG